jgi:cytochrome b involved in lipid metabolism
MSTVEYTIEEVNKHKSQGDLWVVYNGQVYDVSKFVDEHPGGEEVIADLGGQDITTEFDDIGHSDEAHEIMPRLKVGVLKGGVVKEVHTAQSNVSEDTSSTFLLFAIIVAIVAAGGYIYTNFV